MSCTAHKILESTSLMYFRRHKKKKNTLQLLKKYKIGTRANKRLRVIKDTTWLDWSDQTSHLSEEPICADEFCQENNLQNLPYLNSLSQKRPQILYNLPAIKLRIEHGVCKIDILEAVRNRSTRKTSIVIWIIIFLHTYSSFLI